MLQVTCPPVQQRQVWTGPLTILNETPIYSNAHSQNTLQALQQQVSIMLCCYCDNGLYTICEGNGVLAMNTK